MKKSKSIAISALLVIVMLLGMLTGCSQGGANTAAEVGEKLELAIKYLSESNYEQAILAYQDVIKIDPKQVIAYKGIGLAYALQDKMDEAEQALQDGLTAIPGSQEITLTLAGLLVDLDRNDEAEKLYKELIEKDNTYLSALKAYTSYLQNNDRQTEAITVLENAAAKADDYSLDTLLASLYMQTGETEKALASIKASLSLEPGQVEAYDLLLDLYADDPQGLLALVDEYIEQDVLTGSLIKLTALYKMNDYEGLSEYYDTLPQDIKTTPKALYMAAAANLELGDTEKASGLMELIKADNINDALLLAEIAQYYLDAGDKEKARLLAQAGIERDETNLENYLVLYRIYEGEDDAAARIWLLKCWLSSTCDIHAKQIVDRIKAVELIEKAKLHIDEDEFDTALDYCNKAVDIDPTYYWAHAIRAKTNDYLGYFEEAICDSTLAIEIEPSIAKAYVYRAWALNSLKRYAEAADDCIKAIEINGDYYSAYDHLAWAYRGMQQYELSIETCQKGIEIRPDYIYFYPNMAWSYMNMGDYENARKSFQKALEIDEDNQSAIEGLERLEKLVH